MAQTPLTGEVREVTGDVLRTVGHFFRAKLIIAAILTAVHAAAFYAVHMPLWWLGGALVGALSLIPYFGFVVGALAVTLIAALGMTATGMLWVWLILAGGQLLETFILVPRILGRKLSLHPLLVFFAVLVGGIAFGPLGAFLAAPVAAVAVLLWRRRRPSHAPLA